MIKLFYKDALEYLEQKSKVPEIVKMLTIGSRTFL